MGWFGSSGGSSDDYLDSQAEKLVSTARGLATASYLPCAERLPLIYDITTDAWDYFMTVGGVFIAASALEQTRLAEDVKDRLMESVAGDILDWDTNGIGAFKDCKQLFERTHDDLSKLDEYRRERNLIASDSVGLWIAWNLLGRRPEFEERELIRVVGISVTHPFLNWWKPS